MFTGTQQDIMQNWKSNTSIPLVSIRCLTYNQKDYIENSLDGFLSQKTNFPFEIIIHDDASTDGTDCIIRKYEKAFPQLIKPIYEIENQWSKSGSRIARIMDSACRGKYLAFCEGDDYWIDPHKLQRQIDFLENNPDYSLSSENGLVLYTNTGVVLPFSSEKSRTYDLNELLICRRFPTASVVLRKDLLLKNRDYDKIRGDTLVWGCMAQKGKIAYNDTISSVYRRGTGVTESDKIAWAYLSQKFNQRVIEAFHPSKKVIYARNSTLYNDYRNAFSECKNKKLFLKSLEFLAKMFLLNPIRFSKEVVKSMGTRISYFGKEFYYNIIPISPLKEKNNSPKIVISLTSYPARFDTLHLCIKSLFHQTYKADKIILYLDKNVKINDLPVKVKKLQKKGLVVKNICEDIKPHNKYFYAMSEYKDSIIVTADDDLIYPKDWLSSLYKSYKIYPNCVSARRVHKITKDINGRLLPYNNWLYEYKGNIQPSMDLVATGCGGVLYPPQIFNTSASYFKIENIQKYCLQADDIWLKFIEKKEGVKVRYVPNKMNMPYVIRCKENQKNALNASNVKQQKNGLFIRECENFFGFQL